MDVATNFAGTLQRIGLELPNEPGARQRVLEAVEGDAALLDGDELARRHTELWGFREVARELGVSWKTVRKWAEEGRLPTLPEEEWVQGPISVQEHEWRVTPFGRKLVGTRDVVRIHWLMFDPAEIRKVDVDRLRDELVYETLDAQAEDVLAWLEQLTPEPAGDGARERSRAKVRGIRRTAYRLRGLGVTYDRLAAWLLRRAS